MTIRHYLPAVLGMMILGVAGCGGDEEGAGGSTAAKAAAAKAAADSAVVDATVTVDTQATPDDTSEHTPAGTPP